MKSVWASSYRRFDMATSFRPDWAASSFACPVGPSMYDIVKKVALSFGDRVNLVELPGAFDSIRKYGTSDPLINGKLKLFGPASEDAARKAIQEEIDQFKPSA